MMLLLDFAVVVQTATPSVDCTSVANADSVLNVGTVVLLGEIHGTAEGPEAVSRLVCHALGLGWTVTVGLEVPEQEQARIEAYLDGADETEQRQRLLTGLFWQRAYQDGTSSHAMLELLVALRGYRKTTNRLRVVAIDQPDAPGGRDAHMANRLKEEISRAREEVFIVLTGNLHNRLTLGTPFDADLEPMGYLLRRGSSPRTKLLSLRITHSGGTAWVCTGSDPADCGVRELQGQEALPGIEIFADPGDTAFSGRYHVGKISASPPAKNVQGK